MAYDKTWTRTRGNEVCLRVDALTERCGVELGLAVLAFHTPHELSILVLAVGPG